MPANIPNTKKNAARAYKALERQLATTTAHLEAQRTATYQAVAREHEAKQQLAAARQALVEVRTEMDQLKEQMIEVVRTERQSVWEEAAKAWDEMEYSELAKAYPIHKYPKWGNIFAMWCRAKAKEVQLVQVMATRDEHARWRAKLADDLHDREGRIVALEAALRGAVAYIIDIEAPYLEVWGDEYDAPAALTEAQDALKEAKPSC